MGSGARKSAYTAAHSLTETRRKTTGLQWAGFRVHGAAAARLPGFSGPALCLYLETKTARKTALAASERLYMKKPGDDPPVSAILAALAGPYAVN
jgi:hypothetical protein